MEDDEQDSGKRPAKYPADHEKQRALPLPSEDKKDRTREIGETFQTHYNVPGPAEDSRTEPTKPTVPPRSRSEPGDKKVPYKNDYNYVRRRTMKGFVADQSDEGTGVVFWPEDEAEEAFINGPIRSAFDDAGYASDRVWSEYQETDGRPQGVGFYNKEAGLKNWLKWMVQPFSVLWKHHREFIKGPFDIAVDAVIKDLAPSLVRAIGEKEVKEDVDEFESGAIQGRHEKQQGLIFDPIRSKSPDFDEGYEWGYYHADDFRGKLPTNVRKNLVEEALKEFRSRVTREVVEEVLRKIWHGINPKTTLEAIIRAVKQRGWKLGVGAVLFEIFEHFAVPAALTQLTGNPKYLSLATLPIGEVIYAVVLRVIGRTPKEIDEASAEGHLDWYERNIGPVRIAQLEPDFPTLGEWLEKMATEEADTFYRKEKAPADPDEIYDDAPIGWVGPQTRAPYVQDLPKDVKPIAPGGGAGGQVTNNPGSAKVMPYSDTDLANRKQQIYENYSRQKAAATFNDILSRTSPEIQARSQEYSPKLLRTNTKYWIFSFKVGDYQVRVRAFKRGTAKKLPKLNIRCSCTCNFWRYGGPEHWAKVNRYLYGKPRGTAHRPDIRDPGGDHYACKHVVAVLNLMKLYEVRPEKSPLKRLSMMIQRSQFDKDAQVDGSRGMFSTLLRKGLIRLAKADEEARKPILALLLSQRRTARVEFPLQLRSQKVQVQADVQFSHFDKTAGWIARRAVCSVRDEQGNFIQPHPAEALRVREFGHKLAARKLIREIEQASIEQPTLYSATVKLAKSNEDIRAKLLKVIKEAYRATKIRGRGVMLDIMVAKRVTSVTWEIHGRMGLMLSGGVQMRKIKAKIHAGRGNRLQLMEFDGGGPEFEEAFKQLLITNKNDFLMGMPEAA